MAFIYVKNNWGKNNMKSLFAKSRYLQLKTRKVKRIIRVFATFDHNLKNIPLYVIGNIR